MDKPTIYTITTPESSNAYYDMYIDKLLNWADDTPSDQHDYGYVVTRQGEKMIERIGNVIYVQFD